MTLSDAIRLGAMLRPQGFGGLWTRNPPHSCAVGAAYDALGCGYTDAEKEAPVDIRDWLAGGPLICPVCALSCERRATTLAHLNDHHRWTREAIAAFVETIEPTPACDAVGPHPTAHGRSTRAALSVGVVVVVT